MCLNKCPVHINKVHLNTFLWTFLFSSEHWNMTCISWVYKNAQYHSKVWGWQDFFCVFEISYDQQGWIKFLKDTVKTVVFKKKYYCNLTYTFSDLKCDLFLWVQSLISSSQYWFSVSHDSLDIVICWFSAQETFLIITTVENSWKNTGFWSI